MKHLIIILLTVFSFQLAWAQGSTTHTYVPNSVLANGKFVKIKIKESGVYKLTYEDLNAMGVVPENVRIFGYGGAVQNQNFAVSKPDDLPEVAIWQEKGADGVFGAGDYILFYGQGVVKWTYNAGAKIFTHEINPYSLYGYYFVSSDAGTGKKITAAAATQPTETVNEITEFVDYQLHEADEMNILSSGKEFYGEIFSDKTNYDFNFSLPNVIKNKKSVTLRVDVAAAATTTSPFLLSMDNSQQKSISVAAKVNLTPFQTKTAVDSFIPAADNITVSLKYNKPESRAIGYLNYIEINARRALKMTGAAMPFQNINFIGQNNVNKYILADANSNVVIWNVTDKENITQMNATRDGQTLSFFADSNPLQQYLAIDPKNANAFGKPEVVGNVPNQNLHHLQNIDLTIIAYPDFVEAAERLAAAHREMDGITTVVVTPEQVYNEFSSGTPDVSAYRWLMKMLYDRDLATEKEKYLLLFGRGSFDNRAIYRETAGNNLLLTYQSDRSNHEVESYATDDYVGIMTDAGGLNIPAAKISIATGRFPVTTKAEAQTVVDKTIEYMRNNRRGNWKNQVTFFADDADIAADTEHIKQADAAARVIEQQFPAYQVNKIYLDAFQQVHTASGYSYPVANAKLSSLIKSGTLYLNYMGHGSINGLSAEAILSANDVKALSNKNYFLFFVGACNFVRFDDLRVSGGESVLTNPLGGGIGILAASREVFGAHNAILNNYFTEALFKKVNGKQSTIGQAVIIAKNRIGSEINKLSFVYLGDPALKLACPSNYQVTTTEINGNTNIQGNDTLKAQSINTIKAAITDDDGNVITDFNGNVSITIYDKKQSITSLNNDGNGTYTFSDYPNKLYSGKTKVQNGEFTFSFMIPKDIRYNFGAGRINYYAEMDAVSEAQGTFDNFVVGGSADTQITDNEGPNIEWTYLNDTRFQNGGKVNETPYFVARVSDENGINTAGSGIGHDISLMVDNDAEQIHTLNEYFQSDAGSYQAGTVAFNMLPLADGKHTLTFKVWDLLNNSSTVSLDFVVTNGIAPQIFSVTAYPNPVSTSGTVHFRVEHDRPQDVLSTNLEVFDLTGRKIWQFAQSTTDEITWDLGGNNGRSLLPGMYVYRISIKTTNSDYTSKANKLIITKQ